MKRILSGIKPTNQLTIGNYLGAIKNFLVLQEKYEMFIFIADLHSIVSDFNPVTLLENRYKTLRMYLACGLNVEKVKIFFQSSLLTHSALSHILLCHTSIGELKRMTQFKSKNCDIDKQKNNTIKVPSGLLTYPVLMAADILIYDADLVPVGIDQKQHLELSRNIAIRFNEKYGKTFIVPEPLINTVANKITDLREPHVKMSKSNQDDRGTIFLNDSVEVIRKKIMHAITDSLNKVNYNRKKQPGVSNLVEMLAGLRNTEINVIVEEFKNRNYADLKNALFEEIVQLTSKIKRKDSEYNEKKVSEMLRINTEEAILISTNKINEVQKKIGLAEIKV